MSLVKDLINFCWFIFKWGIVPGAILALAAALYVGPRVDREICRQIEQRINQHYPNLKVHVRSAVRIDGQGIEVRDLSISESGSTDPRDTILHVEQMFLHCNAKLVDLIGEDICVDHVTIRRPTFRVVLLPDGTWSSKQLWPPPQFSKSPPNMTIESGTVEIIDMSKSPPSTLTLRDVNISAENLSSTTASGDGLPGRVMRGTLTGDHLGRVEIEGQGHPDRLDWQVCGKIHDLEISPELRKSLPTPLAEQLATLPGFRGHVRFDFNARGDAKVGCRFGITGQITEGRFDDVRLPYPWTNVRANIRADNQGLLIENLFAQGNRSTLWVSMARHTFGRDIPDYIKAKVTQFTLDQRLRAFLPESTKTLWDKYRPLGEIDAQVELFTDGRRLDMQRSRATINCRDMAIVYHKFPYPLDHGEGTLKVEHNVLSVEMVAQAANRPVWMKGQIRQPLDGPYGWFEAKGQNMLLDGEVRKALLNEQSQKVFDMLSPSGRGDFWVRTWRERAGDAPLVRMVLDARDVSIRYSKFPYPLEKIHGRLERLADGTWEFRDLQGVNDTTLVTCNGRLFDGPADKQLEITIEAKNALLDQDLHGALKPAMQQAWESIDPRGTIDFTANIMWYVLQKRLDMVVTAWPHPDTASIRPRMFPYRMDRLDGTLVYRNGEVNVDNFRARHGRTEIAGRGRWNFHSDGSWTAQLKDISMDRLKLDDRDLVQALPDRLREGLAKLNLTGRMYLEKSRLTVHHSPIAGQPIKTEWDLHLGLQPGQIRCGIALDNIRGEVTLQGQSDGKTYYSEGELNLESLSYRKFQFTQVRGPISIDPGRVLLGSWVAHRQQKSNGVPIKPPRAISAKLCGGTLKADAWIAPKNVPCYAIRAELLKADLAQFAKETIPGKQDLRGRVGLAFELEGVAPTVSGLKGRGQLWLHDGNIYELPLMIQVLNKLGAKKTDSKSFSEAVVRFQVAGNHIYMKPIRFDGDLLRLIGQGEMDFDTNIDLAFRAAVGRHEWYVPLISPIMDEAGRQIMTINARGTLAHPEISRDVLPGVKKALRELETNMQGSPLAAPSESEPGRTTPATRPGPLRR